MSADFGEALKDTVKEALVEALSEVLDGYFTTYDDVARRRVNITEVLREMFMQIKEGSSEIKSGLDNVADVIEKHGEA